MSESLTNIVAGTSTVAGIAALPNTGSNPLLILVSILGIVAGGLIIASFLVSRFISLIYKK